MVQEERGRENFASTGRGGAGNAVRSPSRGRPTEEPGEAKAAAAFHANQQHVRAGRGGAGNVRSPSRDPTDRVKYAEMEKKEHQLQADAVKRDAHATHSSGRGGAGNMKHRDESPRGRNEGAVSNAIRSLSRSRSREPRSSSGTRGAIASETGNEKLQSVDESSTINGSTHHNEKQGFVNKIASHIPGIGHSHSHSNHNNGDA